MVLLNKRDIILCVNKLKRHMKMKFFKRRQFANKVKKALDDLIMFKTTLKDVPTLNAGIKYLNEQFSMTAHTINQLNRSLVAYTGNLNCLDNELNELEKVYIQFIEDKKIEQEKLNRHNLECESKATLLTDNEKFIYLYNKKIDSIQESAHNVANKILYVKDIQKDVNGYMTRYVSNKTIDMLKNNMESYSSIFIFENIFRNYILYKYENQYGSNDLKKWLNQNNLDNFSNKKNDESKFGISSRGDNIIYYLDFDVFAQIIKNHFKEGFSEDFKRVDDIVSKLNYLYLVRCKIAHNSLFVTEDEYKISGDYIKIILSHITTKYRNVSNF